MYITIKIGVVIPSWQRGPVNPKAHTQLKLPGESDPLTQLPSFTHRGVVRSVPFSVNEHASSTLRVTNRQNVAINISFTQATGRLLLRSLATAVFV